MKKLIVLLLVIFGFLTLQSCKDKSMDLNVITFNIRLDLAFDSLNSWQYRKDVAAQIIKKYDADIIGTQEVLPNQMQDLKDRLVEYTAIGVGRDDGANKGEFSALFYKTSRFKEHDSGTFWLSETPDIPSLGWDAAYPRIATWAILEDRLTSKKIFVINTHLDHVGKVARINGVKLMLEKAKRVAEDYPVILTGDFNSNPYSDVVQFVLDEANSFNLVDTRLVSNVVKGKNTTFHDYGRIPLEKQECIDYIFVDKNFRTDSYEVIEDKLDGVYLSDHNPVVTRISL